MACPFLRFLDHTQRRITVGRTPLDEWSARLRDLYLTTHNTNNRQTSMSPVGFEPTISAGERPQAYALVRAATGTGPSFTLSPIVDFRRSSRKENWSIFRHYYVTHLPCFLVNPSYTSFKICLFLPPFPTFWMKRLLYVLRVQGLNLASG